YMRAKVAQERLVKRAAVPFTILHSTQFFEFLSTLAHINTQGETVHLPPALVQPVAADDVAAMLAKIAMGAPATDVVELAGPEPFRLDALVGQFLSALQDPRQVITDEQVRYFGAPLDERSLMPGEAARIGATTFANWLEDHDDSL
ncbi:MAG: hypothetical protein R3293_28565, partial [Candidatus Promineifilaceae bacterium]|nr:hypothetical protein [Candidatus Promineifilaceae bacterium]